MSPRFAFAVCSFLLITCQQPAAQAEEAARSASALPYAIVDTGQDRCYDARREVAYPGQGKAFFGQDAH